MRSASRGVQVDLLVLALVQRGTDAQLMPADSFDITALDLTRSCGDMMMLYEKLHALDEACCPLNGTSPCVGVNGDGFGPPEVCSIDCGSVLAPLMDSCGNLLDALAPLDAADGVRDGQATLLRALETKCNEIPSRDLVGELSRLEGEGRCPSGMMEGVASTAVPEARCADARANCDILVAAMSCATDMCPSCPLAAQCDKTCGFCSSRSGSGHRLQDMDGGQCSPGEFADESALVTAACCDGDGCAGVPDECDARCAVPFVSFYDRCSALLRATAPTDMVAYTRLHDTCTSALPAAPLLRLIAACREFDCGNGILETDAGEQCDDGRDGNSFAPDACRPDCQLPTCGDDIQDSGEQCDDGAENAEGGDCLPDCTSGDPWVVLHDDLSTTGPWNAAYWRAHCSPGDSVDPTDYVIRIVMGEVTDYFKPKGGRDLCTVLSAYSTADYTTWSASPHGPFVNYPAFGGDGRAFGGSGAPVQSFGSSQANPADRRTYLSFYGNDGGLGGCCHVSYGGGADWHRAFTLSVASASSASCVGASTASNCVDP